MYQCLEVGGLLEAFMSEKRGLSPGMKIARYELVRLLGSGGSGEVWHAILSGPHGFRREVALKVLKSAGRDQRFRENLAEEARMGAMLAHPNIVSTHELGIDDKTDRWYLAMELVRGCTLTELCKGSLLRGEAFIDAFVQVCEGLGHIHSIRQQHSQAQLVHRDIKPSNLLLDQSGLVKITDLGVARWAGDAVQASGTLGYMPYEQIQGQVDHRSDLFALGVTMARLSTGKRLFGKGQMSAFRVTDSDVLFKSLTSFHQSFEQTVPGLTEVIRMCVRTNPDDRWPDAYALATALARLRAGAGAAPTLVSLLTRVKGSQNQPVATARITAHLPEQQGGFVGRHRSRRNVKSALKVGESVLLHGAAGIGKSRLALHLAHSLRASYSGGVWHVDCSSAVSEEGFDALVGRVFGIPLRDGPEAVAFALDSLGRTLIVLDNIDSVIHTVQERLKVWQAGALQAHFLVTSQQSLAVKSLKTITLEAMKRGDAVALFLRRAGLDERAQSEAGQVVDLLNGNPLAIEMAAARAKVLNLDAHGVDLAKKLGVLEREGRSVLQNSFTQSVARLKPWGREALAQLCVFADGFSLDNADAILLLDTSAPWALDVVGTLVEHALIRYDNRKERFYVDSIISEFASDLEKQSFEEAKRRHCRYFSQFGSRASLDAMTRAGGVIRRRQLREELDNLIAAIKNAWSLRELDAMIGCALAAWKTLELRGPYGLAADLLQWVASCCKENSRVVEVWLALGEALVLKGDRRKSGAAFERVVARCTSDEELIVLEAQIGLAKNDLARGVKLPAINTLRQICKRARQLGDLRVELSALNALGGAMYTMQTGDPTPIWNRAKRLAEQRGDRSVQGKIYGNLSMMAFVQRRMEDCAVLSERAREAFAEVNDRRALAHSYSQEAAIKAHMGDLSGAERSMQEATRRHRRLGSRVGYAMSLCNVGSLVRVQGRPEEALPVLTEAIALFEQCHQTVWKVRATGLRGVALYSAGRLREARDELELSIAGEESFGRERFVGELRAFLSWVELAFGNLDVAVALADQAVEDCERGDDELVVALCAAACAYRGQRRTSDANKAYQRASQVFVALGSKNPELQRFLQKARG